MEAKTSLVRSQGGVVLNAVSIVDLDLEVVVFPDDTELDDTLRDGSDLESLAVLWVLLKKRGVFES